MSVEDLLIRARRGQARPGPTEAVAAVSAGSVLVDIRSDVQRARDGVVPQARFIPRNVLE